MNFVLLASGLEVLLMALGVLRSGTCFCVYTVFCMPDDCSWVLCLAAFLRESFPCLGRLTTPLALEMIALDSHGSAYGLKNLDA